MYRTEYFMQIQWMFIILIHLYLYSFVLILAQTESGLASVSQRIQLIVWDPDDEFTSYVLHWILKHYVAINIHNAYCIISLSAHQCYILVSISLQIATWVAYHSISWYSFYTTFSYRFAYITYFAWSIPYNSSGNILLGW